MKLPFLQSTRLSTSANKTGTSSSLTRHTENLNHKPINCLPHDCLLQTIAHDTGRKKHKWRILLLGTWRFHVGMADRGARELGEGIVGGPKNLVTWVLTPVVGDVVHVSEDTTLKTIFL